MYQGCTREDSLADAAIRDTAGLVLWQNGAPIEAYYCSTCGGHTSRIEAVGSEIALHGLKAVSGDSLADAEHRDRFGVAEEG